LRGTIFNSISHGNIIRYGVQSGAIKLNADVIFEGGLPLQEGEKVFLTIKKDEVIQL
jgi:hypothetical protein